MMCWTKGVAACLVMLTSLMASPVGASEPVADAGEHAGTPMVVSLPGSRSTTYATPVAVVEPRDELTFTNLDLFVHSVRSKAKGPDKMPWCRPSDRNQPVHPIRNPRRFPRGKCPLLWTPPISMTNGVVETKVYGTANLRSGTTIEFYCTVFPKMRGKVIVI